MQVAHPEKLAAAVRARRVRLGDMTQAQVTENGGPSTETLRLIEGAKQDSYGAGTLARLDRALAWRDGTARKILAGTATEEDVNAVALRATVADVVAIRSMVTDSAPADGTATSTVHTKMGGAVARATVSGVDDLTRRVAQLVGTLASTPLRTDAEEAALRALSVLLAERLPPLPEDPEDEDGAAEEG